MPRTTTSTVRALPVFGASLQVPGDLDIREFLPDGALVILPIRFADDFWSFVGFPFVNSRFTGIDFAAIPRRWRTAVKAWLLLRLNPDLARTGGFGLNIDVPMAQAAAAEKPLSIVSTGAHVKSLGYTLSVLESMDLNAVSEADWNAFKDTLVADRPGASNETLAQYVRPLLSIWRYRAVLGLPIDLFGGRPFNGKTPEAMFGSRDRFLNRGRPDADVCGPLLGVSLWIIDHCADDIIKRLETMTAAPDRTELPKAEQLQYIHKRLQSWARSGRPLPGQRNLRTGEIVPAWSQFVRLAGCDRKMFRKPYEPTTSLLRKLADESGVSASEDAFGRPVRVVTDLDGGEVPWIDALPPTKFDFGLDFWSVTLAYACTYVITVLTTVRERELAALPDRCLRPGTVERDGVTVDVTKMHGYLVKNRKAPVAADWIAGEDVISAVKILRRLKKALRLKPVTHPLTKREVLLHPGLGRGRLGTKIGDTLALRDGWQRWLGMAADLFASRNLIPWIPEIPPRLPHRTVRITAIEAYADQEWGDTLAAAMAKWSNRTTAEGYLGHMPRIIVLADPDSAEEVLETARARTLLRIANRVATGQETITGNGAERVLSRLESIDAMRPKNAPVTLNLLNRVARENPNLMIGVLTICAPGPNSVCGSTETANWLLCRPFRCPNSGVTLGQRARRELHRRWCATLPEVGGRALRKIEEDDPNLEAEFVGVTDSDLRKLITIELPEPIARAAVGAIP